MCIYYVNFTLHIIVQSNVLFLFYRNLCYAARKKTILGNVLAKEKRFSFNNHVDIIISNSYYCAIEILNKNNITQ